MEDIEQKHDQIVETVRKENFQGYQMRRDQIITDDDSEVNEEIVKEMVKADMTFFSSSLPRCQEYLDCATTRDAQASTNATALPVTSYKPVPMVSRKVTFREDLNERMTDQMYALRKLNSLMGDDGGVHEIQKKIHERVQTKRDMKELMKLSKAAAESENLKLSKEEEEQVAEVENLQDLLEDE